MLKSEDFDISVFYDKLSRFISLHGNDIPLALFKLFKNYHGNDAYERAMWTLLHGIEILRGDAYTRKVIPGLKFAAENGSEWAELIAIRNLNSKECRERLVFSLKWAANEDRIIWKSIVEKLVSNEPDFKNKAAGILKSLS